MSRVATPARARAVERLAQERFDLLVIGAGILGSRVALDAARAGLTVALVDRGDIACATSSASSKLVHGGFRYLSLGNFDLVREAQRERRLLIRRVAPHLIWPMPLVLAIDRDSPHGPRAIALGLAIYSALCGFREPGGHMIRPAAAAALVPPLRVDGLDGCAVLEEAQTNDSRLTLATAAAAERAGAVVVNYATAVALARDRSGGISGADVATEPGGRGVVSVRARAVVNATGPWLDRVRRLADSRAGTSVRLSKGVHVMLPLAEPWAAGAALLLPDKRNIYAIPCDGGLMLGATDSLYEADPADVAARPEDVAALLEDAARILPGDLLEVSALRCSFAGLRVLPPGDGDTQFARRERVLSVGRSGMVSVAGGKLTTHRAISLEVLRLLPPGVRPRRLPAAAEPLVVERNGTLAADVPADTRGHLLRVYGPDVGEVVRSARGAPDGLERIHPAAPEVWAQVDHAVACEWAVTAEDVTRRRTSLALRGLDTPELRARIGERMAARAAAPESPRAQASASVPGG